MDIPPSHVNLMRTPGSIYSIYPALGEVLWRSDPPKAIEHIAEVLTVFLEWTFGAERKLWELEERLVLGAFPVYLILHIAKI
jgi:hypothetical protein